MNTHSFTIRPATQKDAAHIAELGQIAGHGIPDYLWQLAAEPDQTPLDVGIARASSKTSSFSYRHAHLAEMDHRIAALLIGYRLANPTEPIDLTDVPALLHPLIKLEQCVPGSYYINMLATYPHFQNQRIGARLIERAHTIAEESLCSMVSLQVFEQNDDAVRFYLREGFQIIERRPAIPHPCYPYSGDILLMTQKTRNFK